MGSGPGGEAPGGPAQPYRFEFLPEVQEDANRLSEGLRRAIADIVVELHGNPWLGELMDDRVRPRVEPTRAP